jgi:membrane protease YdiL (CAAX protease family)
MSSDTFIEEKPVPRPTRLGYGPIAAVVVTVIVFFSSQVFVGLLVSLLPLFLGWDTERLQSWLEASVPAQFVAILAVEAITVWLIWRFLKARKVALKTIGLVRPEVRDVVYALIGYSVYFASFIGISVLAKAFLPSLNLDQEQELGFSKETTGAALILVFASLVILPPIAEEIVTRGFLYTGLRKKLPVLVAAIGTSLLFATAHLQGGSGSTLLWVAALDTFTLSMILVYLREKTGSLWSPIIVHMLKNGLAFMLLFVFKIA